MSKIDKSTMEGVLSYEDDIDDDVNDIFTKQICCLKQACFLLDKVFDSHSEEIRKLYGLLSISEKNILTIGETMNHILERLRKLEGENKSTENANQPTWN